jgi:crotonobetainyl-CoA:carnitine CoA-transferase CaiB-like acyl-CoA transferase
MLRGVRVLDLSRVLAGPSLTQYLGDMGADIIKIERPGAGDDTRRWGPPFVDGPTSSAYFASCNRGKRSVAVDLKSARGVEIVQRLAAESDIFVENFKLGDLEDKGLGYVKVRNASDGGGGGTKKKKKKKKKNRTSTPLHPRKLC